MRYTASSLASATNAELCEILTGLGGTPPKSGKFRTRRDGARKILALQAELSESEEKAPSIPRLSAFPPFQELSAADKRAFRKLLRQAKRNRNLRKRHSAQVRLNNWVETLTENAPCL